MVRGGQFILTTIKINYIRLFPDNIEKWDKYNDRVRFLMLEVVKEIN